MNRQQEIVKKLRSEYEDALAAYVKACEVSASEMALSKAWMEQNPGDSPGICSVNPYKAIAAFDACSAALRSLDEITVVYNTMVDRFLGDK